MISADILGERARLTPDKLALACVPGGGRFNYAELNRRAIACAHLLAECCGLRKGERVAILSNNRPEFVDAFFAAAKSGVILVPLNTRQTARELEYVLHDCGARALIYAGAYAQTVKALKPVLALDFWIALDHPVANSDLRYADSVAALNPGGFTPVRYGPEDIYCLLYTSGTTGKPKGVIIPHRMVAWNAYNTVLNWQLRDDDIAPIFTPMYHAGGLGVFLTPLFAIGGTIVLHDGFDAGEVWRALEREKCTLAFGVPTIFKMLMEVPEFESVDLSQVRWFISGGAPLPLYIIEAYQKRGVTFKQGYGLTEAGVNCFAMTAEESARKVGSIGKPMMFTEARPVDAHGRDVASGEVGELLLRGPHVSAGYWNNAEATAAALDRDGWLHTGDLARRDEDGFFYIAGRLKDMIISGGVNIYPAEIEHELLLHPAVQDAAVVGVPHPTWGEAGVAFVVLREGSACRSEELTDFLSPRLGRYKIPKEFVFVEDLPRTPYGKVVKGELRESFLSAQRHGEHGAGEGSKR